VITVESEALDPGPSRDAQSLVVAFSESPRVRETLAVLLERECHLRFLDPSGAAPVDLVEPDMALIAASPAAELIPKLTTRWPSLPIVAIDLADAGTATHRPANVPRSVEVVSFEPEAIRGAVLRRIPTTTDAALRAAVRSVVGTLRSELTYSFNTLRSFVALQATDVGPDAYTILAAVTTEQCHAITENLDYLHGFLGRPRIAAPSGGFVTAVCRQLEELRSPAAQRGMRCVCTVEGPATYAPGPVDLAPLLTSLLHAHLRRRAEASVIEVRATARGVTIRYQARSGTRPLDQSWPLLLASLLIEPRSWRILMKRMHSEEILNLCPVR